MSERPDLDERAGLDDKYEQMLHLADLFSRAGGDLRSRSGLGPEVLDDPDLADSEPLSPATWREAEDEVRAATTGRGGLVGRSVELDADALVVRATVLTYRWIDDLASAAYETLGAIAGRAIGYLAPEVALGGSIVSAGLIETDAADRDLPDDRRITAMLHLEHTIDAGLRALVGAAPQTATERTIRDFCLERLGAELVSLSPQ